MKKENCNNSNKESQSEEDKNKVLIVLNDNNNKQFGFSELMAFGMFILAFITLMIKIIYP